MKVIKGIRLLLVDDQDMVRDGLRGMLESHLDILVSDCIPAQASSEARRLNPDIILTSCHWNKEELRCDADIIVLADSAEYLVAALKAGAAAYLIKDCLTRENLAEVIRQVYQLERSLESVEQVAQLVILPAATPQTLWFIVQLEKALKDMDISFWQLVPSRSRGITIRILLGPGLFSTVLDRLQDMPEVGTVEEESGVVRVSLV